MKKILFFVAATLVVSAASAKIWRVNPHPQADADFSSLDSALKADAVHRYDTLYLEPGNYPYSGDYVRKTITIMGPGWGFKSNSGAIDLSTSANIQCGQFVINADSVCIYGVRVEGNVTFKEPTTSCRMEHCYVNSVMGTTYYSSIRENYIYGDFTMDNSSYPNRDVLVENNVIIGRYFRMSTTEAFPCTFRHNTVVFSYFDATIDPVGFANCIVMDNIFLFREDAISDRNNVIAWDNLPNSTCQLSYNVLSATPDKYEALTPEQQAKLPASNLFAGATVENTFVYEVTGIQDPAARYQLLPTSAAKGAASDGTDCGAFGGKNPYTLCGRPVGVPYIYDVVVPTTPVNDELKIQFKVAGQYE